MQFNETFDLDQIILIPRVVSNIYSRSRGIKTSVVFNKNITLDIPIMASPMKDVCDGKLSKELRRLGGLGIIHRFSSAEEQVKEYLISEGTGACAIGVNGDSFDRFTQLYKKGCKVFCIDVANGASIQVKEIIEKLYDYNVD